MLTYFIRINLKFKLKPVFPHSSAVSHSQIQMCFGKIPQRFAPADFNISKPLLPHTGWLRTALGAVEGKSCLVMLKSHHFLCWLSFSSTWPCLPLSPSPSLSLSLPHSLYDRLTGAGVVGEQSSQVQIRVSFCGHPFSDWMSLRIKSFRGFDIRHAALKTAYSLNACSEFQKSNFPSSHLPSYSTPSLRARVESSLWAAALHWPCPAAI